MLKQVAPIIVDSSIFDKFIGLLEHTGGERGNLLRVLTYHRVDDPGVRPWLDPALISATPETFEAQMKYVAANYQVISVLDLLRIVENKSLLPPRAVMVTFDDGYGDFKQHAWPLLKKHHIPVTLFVPTSFPDHPERIFWWDRLSYALHTTVKAEIETPAGRLPLLTAVQRTQAVAALKNYVKTLNQEAAATYVEQICRELDVPAHENSVLGWDALRELAKEGVTLCPHTQTHPIMNHISPDAMYGEAYNSMQDLEREVGGILPAFAYPSGFHNEEVVRAVERAGFKLAFTTERGINDLGRAHPLQLQRINVGMRTTIPILRAQLLSVSAAIYPLGKKVFR
jgi:peptidoglycan/xylan/chitin deacetylase (PgdA/CDA1 family)